MMYMLVHPTARVLGGKAPELPPTATAYLGKLISAIDSKRLGHKEERELATLSTALDCLCQGKMAQAGDVLIQRFKAIETSIYDGNTAIGAHQELVPDRSRGYGVSTLEEREEATRATLRENKVSEAMKAHTAG